MQLYDSFILLYENIKIRALLLLRPRPAFVKKKLRISAYKFKTYFEAASRVQRLQAFTIGCASATTINDFIKFRNCRHCNGRHQLGKKE